MKHHISYFCNALLEYYPLHWAWCETWGSSSTEKTNRLSKGMFKMSASVTNTSTQGSWPLVNCVINQRLLKVMPRMQQLCLTNTLLKERPNSINNSLAEGIHLCFQICHSYENPSRFFRVMITNVYMWLQYELMLLFMNHSIFTLTHVYTNTRRKNNTVLWMGGNTTQ